MGRPNVNLQLTSIISGKYIACRKLGEGGCGVIYEVALIESPHRRFACKAEDQDSAREEEILKMEAKVMKKINETKSLHCPLWVESGKFDNYNFMIMTLLGPSVSDLRKIIPSQKFTLFTVTVIAVQALDSLRELHNAGYIHRDVKPSNYAIGETGTSKEKVIHIFDFGLARSFRRMTPGGKLVLRNPRRTCQFRGTNRYCSINAHSREEQGRHDDLWSLFYMLVEMLIGSLPWKNMNDHAATEREKTEKEPELLEQSPKEFELYLIHIKQLGYEITPGGQCLYVVVDCVEGDDFVHLSLYQCKRTIAERCFLRRLLLQCATLAPRPACDSLKTLTDESQAGGGKQRSGVVRSHLCKMQISAEEPLSYDREHQSRLYGTSQEEVLIYSSI
ncbi:hypothetical protein RB195_006994 [Necator americanus]|uniref:Protein kinase domain-containing protein n=1 Tax=Necator americanus TaxID=51031 RepID=A0ABR1BV54_NECAM